jgi:hypothetical protein
MRLCSLVLFLSQEDLTMLPRLGLNSWAQVIVLPQPHNSVAGTMYVCHHVWILKVLHASVCSCP